MMCLETFVLLSRLLHTIQEPRPLFLRDNRCGWAGIKFTIESGHRAGVVRGYLLYEDQRV